MASGFQVDEHAIKGQHIRQYPGGSRDQETALELRLKQYSPLDNLKPKPGDATIIVAHGAGFIKELYEPLFEEILLDSKSSGLRVRSIWIADVAQQGASAIANEHELGNDPNYFDISRDMLHMINVFRDQMPRPIFGVGHSIGGTSLVHLAFIHPRLFTSLVLIDPAVYSDGGVEGPRILMYASLKPDFWESRRELEAWVRQNPFYKAWDPRVVNRLLHFGVRDTPSFLHLDKGVTFTTPKHQEAFFVARPNFQRICENGEPPSLADRQTHPDLDPKARYQPMFYRPEPREANLLLPFLRPPVLFIDGKRSNFTTPKQRQSRLDATGTGPGGSGGTSFGQVSESVLDGGHLLPFENVRETAQSISQYLYKQVQAWEAREQDWASQWDKKSMLEQQTMDEEWLSIMRGLRQLAKQTKANL
ncbi:MAG: hypothetical protein LQ342_004329 [Letrouitia transgressa]|nr:MAG: hypothetical protein LQ342_004329 [Letrouitia transgressa]